MTNRRPAAPPDFEGPINSAVAIKGCLHYLEREARELGLTLASHLIGVAAEAVDGAVTFATAVKDQVDALHRLREGTTAPSNRSRKSRGRKKNQGAGDDVDGA